MKVPTADGTSASGRRRGGILLLVGVWALLLAAAGLLYYRVQLQSDSLFLEQLVSDVIGAHGNYSDWRLSPAPAFLPDMALYVVAWYLLPTATLRIFAVSFAQVVLLGLAISYLVRQITTGRVRYVATAGALLGLAGVVLASANAEMWVFFYSTNNHFAALLFGMLGVALTISLLRRIRIWATAALILCVVAGQISTAVFIIDWLIPLVLLLVILLLVRRRLGIPPALVRRLLVVGALALTGAILAILVGRALGVGSGFGRVGFSSEFFTRGVVTLASLLKFGFVTGGPAIVLLSLAITASVLFVLYRLYRQLRLSIEGSTSATAGAVASIPRPSIQSDEGGIGFVMLLAGVSLPVSIAGSVISGGLADVQGYRYFTLPLALFGVAAAALLARRLSIRVLPLASAVAVLLIIVGTTVTYVHFRLRPPQNFVLMSATPADAYLATARCLDDLQSEGETLHAGIADFWFSRAVSLQMKNPVPIVAVTPEVVPYYWMSSIEAIRDPERFPRTYDFAIVSRETAPVPYSIAAQQMRGVLPDPDRIHLCGDREIWVWDGTTLDQTVKSNFATWLQTGGADG
jgi:hypothetical protein